jgi:hypothetical protein
MITFDRDDIGQMIILHLALEANDTVSNCDIASDGCRRTTEQESEKMNAVTTAAAVR